MEHQWANAVQKHNHEAKENATASDIGLSDRALDTTLEPPSDVSVMVTAAASNSGAEAVEGAGVTGADAQMERQRLMGWSEGSQWRGLTTSLLYVPSLVSAVTNRSSSDSEDLGLLLTSSPPSSSPPSS